MEGSFQKDQQNLLYLYDLPKNVSSTMIAKKAKELADVEIDIPPQIRRDFGRHFYTAMLKINDNEKFNLVADKLKYVEFEGKPCRALKFDKEFLGGNRVKLNDRNVFVRKIPKDWKPADLDREFSKYGDIKSLKISLNGDHSSNGYGFVCFKDPQSAQIAIQSTQNNETCQAVAFAPKNKTEFSKVFNNLYVKNFPAEWNEANLKDMFEKFGKTSSVVVVKNENGAFGFVCFDVNQPNGETQFSVASKAVKDLDGKKLDETHTLYVKAALSKSEREVEKQKEMLRYKNSKKRCNLYVKNFPPTTTEQQLRELFGAYGQIESIKLFQKENEAVYAFICFKSPEEASKAKAELHQKPFNGKQLFINHYEIKEIRKAQQEEIYDKTDFQNYKKANTNVTDLLGKPEILAIITQFISLIQPKLNQMRSGNQKRPYQNQGPRGMNQRMGGQMPGVQGGQMMPPNFQQQMGFPPNMNPGMMRGQPPMPQMMGQGMPQIQPIPQAMIPPQYNQHSGYLSRSIPTIPQVNINNPNYKAVVGEVIYEFVEKIDGDVNAPKITGMLIDLPIEEIVGYLKDYSKLEEKVREASTLLQSQQQ